MSTKRKQVAMRVTKASLERAGQERRSRLKKLGKWIQTTAGIITSVGVIAAAAVGTGTWCVAKVNEGTNAKIDAIADQMQDLKLDTTRNQLLVLMEHDENEEEVLKVAKYYFNELKGDWYMTSVFERWADKHGVDAKTLLLR